MAYVYMCTIKKQQQQLFSFFHFKSTNKEIQIRTFHYHSIIIYFDWKYRKHQSFYRSGLKNISKAIMNLKTVLITSMIVQWVRSSILIYLRSTMTYSQCLTDCERN